MLGESITYESPVVRWKEDGPAERFTARYPNMDEFIAYREAIAALAVRKDKPGDPEPTHDRVGFLKVNYRMTLPMLTGYSVDGVPVDGERWKESLAIDPRYMEVVAAIGFELFRGASIESA